MSSEFWTDRWARKEIGFHQRSTNDYLKRYWDRLQVPADARVLVPLCGKTLDMHWLREQGHSVIGVEVVRSAVAEFFDEWGVEAKITNERGFERWQAAGPTAAARGDRGNRRLHRRWARFDARSKKSTVANTAIARELASWCWSLAVMD